ncbi:MAG: hypothetical protein AB1505_05950 [Candidatus Latescibacterota bacterium]
MMRPIPGDAAPGAAPAVYWFNPSCEEEVARGRPGRHLGPAALLASSGSAALSAGSRRRGGPT